MRQFLFSLIILLFASSVSNAEQGQFNLGLEAGFSPIELEAEETAQKIANASGSTVTTEYDYGVLVGRIFAEYGITSELTGEIGYFNTTSADATYTISSDSALESYEASGFDISARLISVIFLLKLVCTQDFDRCNGCDNWWYNIFCYR